MPRSSGDLLPLLLIVLLAAPSPARAQEEEGSEETVRARGVRVLVVPATGPAGAGLEAIDLALRAGLSTAAVELVTAYEARKAQAELGLRDPIADVRALQRLAKATSARWALHVGVTRKGWLYTARAILVSADEGRVDMDFRAAYYVPSTEAADRGARIAKKTAWKIGRLVMESKVDLGASWKTEGDRGPGTPPEPEPPPKAEAPESGGGLFSEGGSESVGGGGGLFGGEGKSEETTAEGEAIGFTPTLRAKVKVDARVAVDTQFDRPKEQVGELALGALLQLEGELAEGITFFAAPKFYYVASIDEDVNDRNILYLEVPEAAVTLATGPFHLRVGTLIFSWGASDLVAPSDVINPVDLRRGITGSENDSKIPVLAAEGVLTVDPFVFRAVFQPFFTPSRFYLSGWDSAFGVGLSLPDFDSILGKEVADRTLDQLVGSRRPSDRPDNGTYALRASLNLDDLDVSVTFFHGWETLPMITFDPRLGQLGAIFRQAIDARMPIDLGNPALAPLLGQINEALARGETLFEGRYARRTLIGGDLVWQVDPWIFKLDVAFTPKRVLYFSDSTPTKLPWLNAVAGFELTLGELQLFADGFVITVFDIPSDARLLFLDARPEAGEVLVAGNTRTAVVPGVVGVIRYAFLESDLQLELFGASTFTRGDVILNPSVRYRFSDHHALRAGAFFIEGKKDSYGGTYTANDQVFLTYEWRP